MRPIILYGTKSHDLELIAGMVAARLGGSWLDLRARSMARPWEVVEGAGDARVVTLGERELSERETLVELAARGTVIRLVGTSQGDGGCGVGSAEGHGAVGLESGGVEQVAEQILELHAGEPIVVCAEAGSYLVRVGEGLWERRLPGLVAERSRVLLVSDENVHRLYSVRWEAAMAAAGRPSSLVVLPAGEEHKHLGTVGQAYQLARDTGVDRSSLVVAVGGGVVTDIGGFVASTWMRGLPWVALPTTLLAMVDASVGGKTGVDCGAAKNGVGCFWQPREVLCDVGVLRTESERNYRSALAEVVKTALIGDAELLKEIREQKSAIANREVHFLEQMVRRSVQVKARIVGLDERESGLRATLNLGHTIGHAFESEDNYGRYTHGEAVSLGMVAALELGVRLGETDPALAAEVTEDLARLALPIKVTGPMLRRASSLIGHDKKRAGGKVRFVFVKGVGRVVPVWLELAELSREIEALASAAGAGD